MTIMDELKTRNFSIYGQWTGVLCILLCLAVGIAGIFSFHWIILFAVICILSGLLIIFIEVPLLLRVCPTSHKFDTFVRRFETNYMRAAIYFIMSLIQWLSLVTKRASSLIAAAVLLLIAALFYLVAGVKGQGFVGSKTLGGQGVAQMIV